MSTGPAEAAHATVAAFRAGDRAQGAWMLDRAAVASRLDALIDEPDLVRQGRLNLCGPAALFAVWFARDPVAATTFAVSLYEHGQAPLGDLAVTPSPALRRLPYERTGRARSCPPTDWMMMSALRDSSNRWLRYAHQGGPREAAAAITVPAAMRRWLTATAVFSVVRDETNLVWRKGIEHAQGLVPGPDRELFLLVAQEMFHASGSALRRTRDRVASLFPNHWVILRAPIEVVGDEVRLRFWSWGTRYTGVLNRALFAGCYYGALIAIGVEKPLPAPPYGA